MYIMNVLLVTSHNHIINVSTSNNKFLLICTKLIVSISIILIHYKTDSTEMGYAVITVNATDKDAGVNGEIHYSLLTPVRGFTIDDTSGAIQVNRSAVMLTNPWDPVLDLVVVATDGGTPPLTSRAAVRIHVNNAGNGHIFGHDEFRYRYC